MFLKSLSEIIIFSMMTILAESHESMTTSRVIRLLEGYQKVVRRSSRIILCSVNKLKRYLKVYRVVIVY